MTLIPYLIVSVLLFLFLTINIIRIRNRKKIALLDGNEILLQQSIRAHGNFTEYTPFFFIILFIAESLNFPHLGIHLTGCMFVMGRLLHAYSLISHEKYHQGKIQHFPVFRVSGMMLTLSSFVILTLYLLYVFLFVQNNL